MRNVEEKHGISLRGRLIAAFLLFTAAVLVVLWLFETVLLDDIYRSLKLRDIEKCAAEAAALDAEDDEDYQTVVGAVALQYDVCLTVYRVTETDWGPTGVPVAVAHNHSFCLIHNYQYSSFIGQLYHDAKDAGGSITLTRSLRDLVGGNREAGEAEPDIRRRGSDRFEEEDVISVRIVPEEDTNLLILIDSELVPLDATVRTLHTQLVWITVILVLLSILLATVLASRVSKPIRKMSEEASKLAMGDYAVNFDGTGSAETENLSATLNRAAYELSKLDRMQKDLIANVSHDLRTPLTMISGYTEVMRDLPGEATPENFQIVLDECDRLTNLVTDMLEVSKYQNGTQKLNTAPFNFTAVIRRTLERYQKLREHDGYVIRFEAEEDVWVNGDESRLLQVVYNLINNAVNYTGDDKTVVIRQTVSDGEVLVEVIDTGIGIAEEELPLVWERYYKANDFHKRANMGTGLGLSIVRSILQLHGAQFGVKSRVGQGSNFWFRLKTIPAPGGNTSE
ncbi:MAG: HAMP domain-containing protein [Clostridia bacterium]|nr:HAMP domain-containing protein [Clostridia bacterium]MBR4184858.1 HAMP domain-containing protein [Clostridia bacterium]